MSDQSKLTFQFISEPTDVNFGGKVHGGVVMKWIDQTAYACARTFAETYCVTVYVGGIRFMKPINIGDIVKVKAYVIHTGNTSIHIAVDVYARNVSSKEFEKKTHCVIVFVSVDSEGKPMKVKNWKPTSEREQMLENYAIKLKDLRGEISQEMLPYLNENTED